MPIVLEHLSHTYFDGTTSVPAVKDVSLEIREGEFLSIIGHTGCGKTTLVQHLNGLLLPTSGKVLVDGLDTADKKLRPSIRTLVGMVFQYPEYQLFADTVREDVGFGPKNRKLSEEEIALRVSEAMAMVGLSMDKFAEKSPFELSGGEKRRAAQISGVGRAHGRAGPSGAAKHPCYAGEASPGHRLQHHHGFPFHGGRGPARGPHSGHGSR